MFEDGGEGGEGEKREGNGRQVDAVRPPVRHVAAVRLSFRHFRVIPAMRAFSPRSSLSLSFSLCVGGRGGKRKERCSSPEGASNDRNVSLLLTDEKKKEKEKEKEKSVP